MGYSRVKKYSQDLKDEIKKRKKERKKLKAEYQRKADIFLYAIFFFIFLYEIYFFIFSHKNIFSFMKKQEYKEQLLEESKKLDRELQMLEKKKLYLEKDNFYIEKEARERLGYMKKGEKIFIIPEKEIKKGILDENEKWIKGD
jgi:cell division protein FtsB